MGLDNCLFEVKVVMNNPLEDCFLPGKNVLLEFAGPDGEKNIFQTSVIRSINKERLNLLMTEREPSVEYLQPNSRVSLICFQGETVEHKFIFDTEFLELKPGEAPILVVKRPVKIESSSRRRYFRCDVRLPFSYFLRNKEYKGEVTNLSAGGLFVLTEPDPALVPGARIACKLFLPKIATPFLFVAKIVNTRRLDKTQGIALSFQQLNKDFQAQITRYLFQQQRMQLLSKRKRPD